MYNVRSKTETRFWTVDDGLAISMQIVVWLMFFITFSLHTSKPGKLPETSCLAVVQGIIATSRIHLTMKAIHRYVTTKPQKEEVAQKCEEGENVCLTGLHEKT